MASLGEFGEIIFEFPVLYDGWESDNKAYIVSNHGQRKLVMSNHGRLYYAEESELDSKIREYEEAIEKSRTAIQILCGHRNP